MIMRFWDFGASTKEFRTFAQCRSTRNPIIIIKFALVRPLSSLSPHQMTLTQVPNLIFYFNHLILSTLWARSRCKISFFLLGSFVSPRVICGANGNFPFHLTMRFSALSPSFHSWLCFRGRLNDFMIFMRSIFELHCSSSRTCKSDLCLWCEKSDVMHCSNIQDKMQQNWWIGWWFSDLSYISLLFHLTLGTIKPETGK